MQNLSSSPFRLRERLREKLDAGLEPVPLFNVLLIVVLLMLTGSKFIFAPGISVKHSDGDVAGTTSASSVAAFALSRAETPLPGTEASAVLTVKSDAMFIFGEHIYETPEQVFARMGAAAEGEPRERRTLLLKLNRSVSVQGLFKIAELAGKAGFDTLQIAGESPLLQPENTR